MEPVAVFSLVGTFAIFGGILYQGQQQHIKEMEHDHKLDLESAARWEEYRVAKAMEAAKTQEQFEIDDEDDDDGERPVNYSGNVIVRPYDYDDDDDVEKTEDHIDKLSERFHWLELVTLPKLDPAKHSDDEFAAVECEMEDLQYEIGFHRGEEAPIWMEELMDSLEESLEYYQKLQEDEDDFVREWWWEEYKIGYRMKQVERKIAEKEISQ